MVQNAVRELMIALALALAVPPAAGQAPDTICVEVEQLQRMRQELETLRARDSLSERRSENYRAQITNLSAQAVQDSLIADALERRATQRARQVEWSERRIEHLNGQLRSAERRRWLYFTAGAAAVVLGGYAASLP